MNSHTGMQIWWRVWYMWVSHMWVTQVHVSGSLTCAWRLVSLEAGVPRVWYMWVSHSHVWLIHVCDMTLTHWYMWESHITHTNEPCRTYEWVIHEPCRTYEWVMSHIHEWAMSYIWMSHSRMSHVDEPCRTYEWVMSHIHEWAMAYIWMSHSVQIWWRVWYMPCRHVVHIGYIVRDSYTYSSWLICTERVVESLVHAMSSCRTYEWVTSHLWTHAHWHVEYGPKRMNESCLTHKWVMSHTWTSHVTHMDSHTGMWIMAVSPLPLMLAPTGFSKSKETYKHVKWDL